jgi:hypothetical protein
MLSYTEHGKFRAPKQALTVKKGLDGLRSGIDFCERVPLFKWTMGCE